MSKIPQGEWNAIAARYAQGESISAIARTYGCTPPAIHYILKNNRRRAAQPIDQWVQEPRGPSPTAAETPQKPVASVTPRMSEPDRNVPASAQLSRTRSAPSIGQALAATGARQALSLPSAAPIHTEQHAATPPQQPFHTVGRTSAGSDGLDSELHDRAEAAIETFRSCFDAALAVGSSRERARLREAASNLMRVAARTTIVLDRLTALSERSGFDRRPDNGPRV
jgi:transposase-like protein